ncbi:MAG: choice-of-anchor D domain-containing protein [Acidimicrobiia bacterium]|nr:choice-of-anchor D domain-containing protein [Acidimicrobiia bacterium]
MPSPQSFGVDSFQGFSIDTATGEQYLGDAANNQVLVLDSSGQLNRVLDLSSAGVGHLQDLAVAPSGDQTDDPDVLSLYVVDDGSDPATVKEITTTTVVEAALAVTDVATVVQTINTGTGINPNSPDSSGISWLTSSNQLVLSDSEVNEYSYFENVNVWHMTTSATVNSTGVTTDWSNEPTGLTVDNAGGRSFTTDDNAKTITEVLMGPDNLPGTPDDVIVTEFSTLGFGNSDPEDVAYDTTRGWLHIADGANKEVFTIDPGPNGQFEGGGDDIITQWDTEIYGVRDPEGIAYDANADTLTVVDYQDTTAVEFTVFGAEIRQIDMAASGLVHPAGATWAPGSDGVSISLWVVDRGIDGASPRDGQLVELAVPTTGGPPVPEISVSPTSLSFGSVVLGTSGVGTVTVTNLGSAPLSVTATTLGGDDPSPFSIDSGGAPFTLGPGTSQNIDLSFTPTALGSSSATLTIDSDDADEPSVVVPLSGDGVDVPPPSTEVTVGAVYQGGSSASAFVTSGSVSVTPGNLYLAVVTTKSHQGVVGVSGLGGSWSLVDTQCAGRSQTGITVYSTTNAGSSGVVTATLDGSPSNAAIAVVEYAGADQASPLGSPQSANTNGSNGACSGGIDSNTYSVPVTTTGADSMVTGFVAIRNRTHSPGLGFTELVEFAQGSGGSAAGMAIQTQSVPSPTTVDVAGLIGGDVDWAVVAVEIKGGPAGPPIPDIAVNPGSVAFGPVVTGSSGSASVSVTNEGTGPLSVSATTLGGANSGLFSIDSGGGAFTLAPGASQNIDLLFSPTALGSFSATLTIDSDDPDEPSVVVPLSGDGVSAPPPDIAVNPTSVSFGSVLIGSSASASVTVSNEGTGSLSVTATTLGGANSGLFSIDSGGGAFVLAPGESRAIGLSFSPAALGSFSATLTIDSDDPDEPSVVVPLSGDGVDVPPPSEEVTVEAVYQGGSSGSAFVASGSVPVTQGNLYLAVVSTKSHQDVIAVSGLNATWSLVDAQCGGRSQTGITVYSTTSATAAGTVTATLSGAATHAAIAVVEYAGADQASPLGTPQSANTNGSDGGCAGGTDSASYSLPVTTTTTNSMVTGFVAIRNKSHTPGAGFTELVEFTQGAGGGSAGMAIQTQSVPSPTTVDVAGTINGRVDWAVIAVEVKGGPAGPPIPDIAVSPASVAFGPVVTGSSGSASVTVTNQGTGPLSVSSTTLGGTDATLFSIDGGGGAFVLGPGTSQVIDLSFSPGAVGSYSATLTIDSDDPDEASVVVPLSGDGVNAPPPDIAVSPTSVSFGSVVIGSSGSASVLVTNEGGGSLSVSSTTLGGTDATLFSIDAGGGAFTLAPGGSQVIDLSFSPAAVGSYSATLTIDSDDPDEASVAVPLTGDGVDVPPPAGEVKVEAVYQGGSSGVDTVSSAPVSATFGRLYLAAISTKSDKGVVAVNGLGASWQLVDGQCAGRSQTGMTLFATTGASGVGPVTATLSSAPTNAVIAVIEYSGADTVTPVGSPVSANTNGLDGVCGGGIDAASYSVPISTQTSNSMVTSFVAIRSRSHTEGAGFTELLEFFQGSGGGTAGMAVQNQLVPNPTSLNASGTTSSTVDFAVIAVEIRTG